MATLPDESLPRKSGGNAAMTLEDQIFEYVRLKQGVTFVELQRYCESLGIPGRGDVAMTIDPAGHIVIGWNLSAALYDAVKALLKARRLFFHPCSLLPYIIDGELLHLPLVTRNYPYQTDHWMPATLNTRPYKPQFCKRLQRGRSA
jgi:hypothetical protein